MPILKRIRTIAKEMGYLSLALILLALSNSPGVHSGLDLATSPYEFRLVRWELDNLPDKWWRQLAGVLPWSYRDHVEPNQLLGDFAALAEELRWAEAQLDRSVAAGNQAMEDVQRRIDELRRGLDSLSPRAQAVLESEITRVLKQEGLHSRLLLGAVFPPVDLVFSNAPLVLVVSPRDRIEREHSALLDMRMTVTEIESLEERLFQEQDVAALVLRAGGLASYPSMVSASGDLYHVTTTSVHEWLHQYWFFRPMGRNYFTNTTMTALNETAADLAGDELGGIVYEAITGQPSPAAIHPEHEGSQGHPEAFSFYAEMRETRLQVDSLLEQGLLDEAEAYMEERRRIFVDNGYHLRKLNQAYFAFHGSYGSSPASVSPIHGQVERVRANASSIGEFVRTISQFGTYATFEEYVAGLPPVHVVPNE